MRALFLVLTLGAVVLADETGKLSPKAAWEGMQKELADARVMRDGKRVREIQETVPGKFLAEWDKSGQTVTGEELFYLAHFYQAGQRAVDAMRAFHPCATDESLPERLRDYAKVQYARLLAVALTGHDLDGEEARKALGEADALMGTFAGAAAQRATALSALGIAHCKLGDRDTAVERWHAAVEANAGSAYAVARNAVATLLEDAADVPAYDAVRATVTKLLPPLVEVQTAQVAKVRESGDEQLVRRAESTLDRMQKLSLPAELLGQPAPAWTLERAYGKGKALQDYQGKVVMLDFWATWCPWCIKSFPALRDLLRDYGDKGFAVVGVTASARYVWETRYELDDDFKEKAPAEGRTPPTLRRDQVETEEEFRAKEKEIIAKFIANHQMTWDVVMIDQQEPAAKYALTGWPHAVVLDRKGRIRYFKRGALLRDRPEAVAKFRKVLDKLLAERD